MASGQVTFRRLVDLIEGRLSQTEAQRLRAQIVGDAHALADVRWLERVIAAMRRDDTYDEEPPPEVAARAIRLLQARRPRRRLQAILHFDSLQLPQPVGIRSGHPAERQLLFAAGELSLDLRVAPAGPLWTLAGQVLGPAVGGGRAALASPAASAEVVLNELSEFALPPVPAGSYTLTLRLPDVEVEVNGLRVG